MNDPCYSTAFIVLRYGIPSVKLANDISLKKLSLWICYEVALNFWQILPLLLWLTTAVFLSAPTPMIPEECTTACLTSHQISQETVVYVKNTIGEWVPFVSAGLKSLEYSLRPMCPVWNMAVKRFLAVGIPLSGRDIMIHQLEAELWDLFISTIHLLIVLSMSNVIGKKINNLPNIIIDLLILFHNNDKPSYSHHFRLSRTILWNCQCVH